MSRRGFTIMELAVALAIVGLLCALIAPAIMSVRATARKMECSSHLRQLGLAAANYATTHNCMPPGIINSYSWLVMLLPYVDQGSLYGKFDFTGREMNTQATRTQHPAYTARIPLFKCVDDSLAGTSAFGGAVRSSYHGCTGSGLLQGGYNGLIRNTYEGCVFGRFPAGLVRLGDVPNGVSNTVMASERLVGEDNGHLLRNNWFMTSNFLQPSELDAFRAACLVETPRAIAGGGGWYGSPNSGQQWWNGTIGTIGNTMYNHTMTPNQQSCSGPGMEFGAFTASSLHPGGVNVVYGDGHAALVSQHVDSVVWTKMGSRVDRDLSSCP